MDKVRSLRLIDAPRDPFPVRGDVERLGPWSRAARARFPVALVTMPFASTRRPSIQIGLLKAIVETHGFPASTFHLNLEVAQRIGAGLYDVLSRSRIPYYSDWLFGRAAFPDDTPDPEDRLLDDFAPFTRWMVADLPPDAGGRERLLRLRREELPALVAALAEEVPWGEFRAVGFTSTFQQNVASFALAREIKRRHPEMVIIFGGANFDDRMGREWARVLPWLDFAVIGEGDLALPELLVALAEGKDTNDIAGAVPGPARRGAAAPEGRVRAPFESMDELPPPDYDEYFERAERLGMIDRGGRREVDLPFESARGCWWGAKHHCTFCGLNDHTMGFRAKSPERVLAELAEMAGRYRNFKFTSTDNILEPSYLRSMLPRLVEQGIDYSLFYEIKANLTRQQIKLLADSGVRRIQPGIESFSSHVLKLMRKGITGIQNVNTLRWARYYQIQVAWNLLWGFPGEAAEDYRRQAELLPHLYHLAPPTGGTRIMMERFSPVFEDREGFPATHVKPQRSYAYIYPREADLQEVAYDFEYELENTLPEETFEPLNQAILGWHAEWQGGEWPSLTFYHAPGLVQVEDRRRRSAPATYTFRGRLASLYVACCDKPRNLDSLAGTVDWSRDEIAEKLDDLCHRGLMMRDGALYLSLALPSSQGR